jgi:hypothetical protein
VQARRGVTLDEVAKLLRFANGLAPRFATYGLRRDREVAHLVVSLELAGHARRTAKRAPAR